MILTEAMAAGRPFVSTPTGGVASLADVGSSFRRGPRGTRGCFDRITRRSRVCSVARRRRTDALSGDNEPRGNRCASSATVQPVASTDSHLYYRANHARRLNPVMSVSSPKRSDLFRWRPPLGAGSLRTLAIRGLVPCLGAILIVRVLFDDRSSPDSHQSGSLNLSGGIAVLLIVVAAVLLLRRRQGLWVAILTSLWLCVWTAVAVSTHGASTETLREGVREESVVAVAVIVYNAYGAVTIPIAARMVQCMGFIPAVLALYQLVTNTGADIYGEIRSNGTFAHRQRGYVLCDSHDRLCVALPR